MTVLAALPGQLGPLVLQYLALFRPAHGGLRYTRMLTLLEALTPAIRESRITRNGRTWPAPQAHWTEALQQLVSRPATLRLPLKSHAYLFEILAALGSEFQGQQERAHEQRLRRGARDGERRANQHAREPTPAHEHLAGLMETLR